MNRFRVPGLTLVFSMLFGLLSTHASAKIVKGETSCTSGGKKIRIETWFPKDDARHPAVMVLYGSGGNLLGKGEMVDVAKRLAEKGFSVFLVHYFNRTGTIAARDKQIWAYTETWADTVHDAAVFIGSHPRVSPGKMGAYGYSLGAYMAVAESSKNPRIGAVAERSGGVILALKGKIKRLSPILIIHGRQDQRVEFNEGLYLEGVARKVGAETVTQYYDNEGHGFTKEALADAQTRSIDFLTKRLGK